jgi:hypothetical protein
VEKGEGVLMAESFTPTTIRLMQYLGRFVGPRAQITGKVVYKASQSDGDMHIILADPSVPDTISTLGALTQGGYDFVVCEAISEIPLANGFPVLHSTVTVQGLARWDFEHGWPEIHPVLSWVPAA